MPSLFRFLTVVAIIGGIGYGVIFALANFVNPEAAGNDRHHPAGQVPQEIGAMVFGCVQACTQDPQTPN